MKTPTDRWGAWLEAAQVENMVSYRFVRERILPELRIEGFAVPSQRSLQEALVAGLDASPARYSFAHVMNLLWMPLIEYMDLFTLDHAPEWTETLALHHTALLSEMDGIIASANESMDMDLWIEFISETLNTLLKVHVPKRLIMQVLSPIVPFHLAPTPANALHLLRSGWCCKLVGPALAAHANRLILAKIADVPVQQYSDEEVQVKVRQDLIASLELQHCGPELDETEDSRPAKKLRRDLESVEGHMKTKTEQVKFMLQNRLASSRVNATVESAGDLIQMLSPKTSSPCSTYKVSDDLVDRTQLLRHLILLDGAVDRYASDKLLTLREEGRIAGVALVTDESPPSQPRFRGLRFQITVFYWGTYLDLSKWESKQDPPIVVTTCLADIMHCPGKKGVDVSRIIEKQLARLGLNCFDVTAGTGDGGGENEGQHGVHAYFENLNPGYVRRRCLPHISWRTCDVAIRVSGLDYRTLASYLVEGITWSRMRELATREPGDGGLGLFRDGSRRCKDVFGRSPSAIVDSRPETDLNFLKLLEGKEHILHRLATKDLDQRSLNAETKAAVLNLGDIKLRIRRRVLQEILERCMFLLYWTAKHPTVACDTTWDQLMQMAVTMILSLEITPLVLERFKMIEADVVDVDARPKTWVELAVLQVVGDQDLVAEHLPEALDFHRSVSDTAAAHLNLLADNTYRTPWLAAKLLSKNKILARDAAATLVKHLVTIKPKNRTAFESHFLARDELWKSLENFSKADPPVLLWHGQGRYETLFKYLAPRFLLAPDHVLDAERIHARWQWSCGQKHALKLQTLNASLRLMHHMEHNQGFPSHADLLPNLQAERLEHKLAYDALVANDEVALGWRHVQNQIEVDCKTTIKKN
jgi:hypothetical protein